MAAKKKSTGTNKPSPITTLPPVNPQAKGGFKQMTNTPPAPKGKGK